ncbi:DUF2249 domain-containing protein [Thauera aromatica]|uniref:DUF2249 domain-containing protein n=1 Tax=Thauera aromatica K172 TaxID=44139 RepID=A0A2R4BLT3_THAAR|nr:DUF2249 domain-containing protein [Thauera aromatica]AVR88289.1 hypothetical protein Tharo_1364 [Thauera aromatica K172]MCK2087174.1 DUF2249 domain-containing protein [Thauera aromatica]MCK2096241.1 DUF2249 domain-containing protein [Thauera aromatica]
MSGRVVDARGLEPPEPFERAMEVLLTLAKGEDMLLILDRMPHPLLRILDRDGYRHDEVYRDDGAVEIRIVQP